MHSLPKFVTTVTLAVALLAAPAAPGFGATGCPPTEPDEVGPFYRPGAPTRAKIGEGYLLTGSVRSSADCKPVARARIEVWQAGPGGRYDDAHRATLHADANGNYRLETDFPPPYMRRPPHIHILVEAPGFRRLITQHYPAPGGREATFDLVLIPAQQ
ncbi:MAG: intradiol ring-cleavage dioxygenase [Geobacteraceae bacterium]|nr:intradiol ring-cleavage dioxygenase [Geobacteraceae bacterium]